MKSYLFILGNHPALSVAEILSKFQSKKYSLINKEVLMVKFDKKIETEKVIKKLGGTIKIVELLEYGFNNPEEIIKKYLPEKLSGKFNFGFSFYGKKLENEKELAMSIKKELKKRKISCRWIAGKGGNLSSVVFEKNHLIKKGSDFVVVFGNDKLFFGVTRAVQDFEGLSFRDYNRPARDSHSGMIPPKLAQIMLNIGLQGKIFEKTFLDSFCGSGTILMEAGLLGVKKIIGTDISKKAVENSRKNFKWSMEEFHIKNLEQVEIKQADVTGLSNLMEKNSIDLIVTEPYLGPQNEVEHIEKAKIELEKLYSKAFQEFKKILRKGGRVVMIWPYLRQTEKKFLNPNFEGFKIVEILPKNLSLETTKRETIIYGRKGQRVWREIVVLESI